jgi:arginine utilization protein RocB
VEETAGAPSAMVQAVKETVNLNADTNSDGNLDSEEWAAALIAYVQSIAQTQTPFVVLTPATPFIIFKK